MGIKQTEESKICVLTRTNRIKIGSGQTEILVLTRRNRPKDDYWADQPDQNVDINHTEQTKIGVLARLNRTKYGYCPE